MSIEVGSKLQGKITGITNLEHLLNCLEAQPVSFTLVR